MLISLDSANRCCRSGFLDMLSSNDENLTAYVALVLSPTISHSTLRMIVTTSLRPVPTGSMGVVRAEKRGPNHRIL